MAAKKNLQKLIESGRLKKEANIGFDQIQKRIQRARQDLASAQVLLKTDNNGAFQTAYDVMRQAGLSLVFSYGHRPAVSGFHKIVVEACSEILGSDFEVIIRRFDQARQQRHQAIYDDLQLTDSEAASSIKLAQDIIDLMIKTIRENNPQLELFK
mgnify:CR=1 FL=1